MLAALRRASIASLALPFLLALSACDDGGGEDGGGDGDGDAQCGDAWGDTKDPDVPNLQENWGSPCESDGDCGDVLEGDAFCVGNILDTYTLPGGYCSVRCELPDNETVYVFDDPMCDPNGGVDCIGVKGFFEACAVPCDDDSDCHREGYACSRMPDVSSAGDRTYCLMEPTACCLDPEHCGPDAGN